MTLSIGIVGGAGPMAGALLFGRVIQLCQEEYGCKADCDFPLIKLVSFPFDQMLNDFLSSNVATQLEEVLTLFEKDGIELVSIACNTLHCFLPNLDQYGFEFVSIIDETDQEAFVLCTNTSRRNQIHRGLYPDIETQIEIDAIIHRVLTGTILEKDALRILEIAKPYERCILGCTELSLINEKYPMGDCVIDPLERLARNLCYKAFYK